MKSTADFSDLEGFAFGTFRFRHGARAFTLVELLVVIAIVGLLAALIIAGLPKAREAAGIAKSSSQMRQIASAALLWANDNRGCLPTPMAPALWYQVLYPYIYNTNAPSPFFGANSMGENLRGTVFYCPLKDQAREVEAGTPVRSYGWNMWLKDNNSNNDQPVPMARIGQPSKTMMLATTVKNSGVGTSKNQWNFSTRAGGRTLVIFTDGHLERLMLEDIPTSESDLFWKPEGSP
jgi:prepilin-type N-terminal cleavage/methylation domain-containing protein